MKPFNPEAWKAGQIAINRDGQECRFLGTIDNTKYPYVGAHKDADGCEDVLTFTVLGMCYNVDKESIFDLLWMKPVKVTKHLATFDQVQGDHRGAQLTTAAYIQKNELEMYLDSKRGRITNVQYHEITVEE